MTTSIDLDLVELRCRIRGWTLVRAPANCPRPDAWTVRDGDGIVVASHGYTLDYARPTGTALLTAPRWTLERLLSEPPEGWRVVPPADPDTAVHVLARGDDPEATRVALGFVDSHGLLVSANVPGAAVGPEGLARLAERHKAASELALILAEVEP